MKIIIGLPVFIILATIGLFVICRGLYLDKPDQTVGGVQP